MNAAQEIEDRTAITDLIYKVARAMDSRDWDLLADCYDPRAQGDYTNAAADGRDAIVASARGFLNPLDATQHLIGNVEVDLRGDTATTHATFIAQHVRADAGQFLMGGTYDDTLRRTTGGWRITSRRIRGIWSSGDPAVLTVPV